MMKHPHRTTDHREPMALYVAGLHPARWSNCKGWQRQPDKRRRAEARREAEEALREEHEDE